MPVSIWTSGNADEISGGRRRVKRRMSVIIVSEKMSVTIANGKTSAATVVGPGLLGIVCVRLRPWLRIAGLEICLARRPERRDMSGRVLTVA
jgi:hypothetical protein